MSPQRAGSLVRVAHISASLTPADRDSALAHRSTGLRQRSRRGTQATRVPDLGARVTLTPSTREQSPEGEDGIGDTAWQRGVFLRRPRVRCVRARVVTVPGSLADRGSARRDAEARDRAQTRTYSRGRGVGAACRARVVRSAVCVPIKAVYGQPSAVRSPLTSRPLHRPHATVIVAFAMYRVSPALCCSETWRYVRPPGSCSRRLTVCPVDSQILSATRRQRQARWPVPVVSTSSETWEGLCRRGWHTVRTCLF